MIKEQALKANKPFFYQDYFTGDKQNKETPGKGSGQAHYT